MGPALQEGRQLAQAWFRGEIVSDYPADGTLFSIGMIKKCSLHPHFIPYMRSPIEHCLRMTYLITSVP